jgi:hypothetical protein
MEKTILLYKDHVVAYRVNVFMTDIDLVNQLKSGILLFDTVDGTTEIYYLNNFDKVEVSVRLYDLYTHGDYDGGSVDEVH